MFAHYLLCAAKNIEVKGFVQTSCNFLASSCNQISDKKLIFSRKMVCVTPTIQCDLHILHLLYIGVIFVYFGQHVCLDRKKILYNKFGIESKEGL